MEEKTKISIITIVYNDVVNIERTICSVLFEQKYDNLEYIVIDGGSTDGTVELIQKYNDKINIFISEKDSGISDAFNKGIRLATGELIGLINSGDYYEPEILTEISTRYEEKTASSRYIVLHGNIRLFNDDLSKIYIPYGLNTFYFQMPIWHPTCFVSRTVYIDFEYDLNFKIAMDYELFSRVYASFAEFRYINQTVAHMNIDGVSNNHAARGFDEVAKASISNLNVPAWKAFIYKFIRKRILYLMNIKRRLCSV